MPSPHLGTWESWCRGHEQGRAGRLTSSDTTQAQIQVFELAHANTFPIYELLSWWRGRSCWSTNSGSWGLWAKTGYPRVSRRVWYWWCSKTQRLWTTLMTHCHWEKRLCCATHGIFRCHTMNEYVMERWERWRRGRTVHTYPRGRGGERSRSLSRGVSEIAFFFSYQTSIFIYFLLSFAWGGYKDGGQIWKDWEINGI